MTMRELIIPWTSQPQEEVGASQEWINDGLVALFDCRAGVERVLGVRATTDTLPRIVSTSGVAPDFSSAGQVYPHRTQYAVTGPVSILVICDVDALTTSGALISKQATVTTNGPYEVRIGDVTTSQMTFLRAAASSYLATKAGSNLISAGATSVNLLFTDSAQRLVLNSRNVWVNGTKNPLTTVSGGTNSLALITDNGSSSVYIGRRYDGGTQLDGRIYMVAVFNKELSDDEARALSANPWQLYEPLRLFVPSDLGGGGASVASVTAIGIPSQETSGSHTLYRKAAMSVLPGGVVSGESFGTVSLGAGTQKAITTIGIASAQAVSNPVLVRQSQFSVSMTGIGSSQAIGSHIATRIARLSTSPTGIVSGELFGAPTLVKTARYTVTINGMPSTELFGNLLVIKDGVQPITQRISSNRTLFSMLGRR